MSVTDEIASFALRYLRANNPESADIFICVLNGYDCIEDQYGVRGFGAYSPEEHMIYLAGELPCDEEEVFRIISHEYRHFQQHIHSEAFDESQAEAFANLMKGEMLDAWFKVDPLKEE